jgi:hypothetical protein
MFGHIRDYFADIFGTSEEDKQFGRLLEMFDKVQEKRTEANQFINDNIRQPINENIRQPVYEAVDKVIPMELLQMGGVGGGSSAMPDIADARAPNAVSQLQSVMANAGIQNAAASMLKPSPPMMQAPEFAPRAPDNFMPINPMDEQIEKIEEVVRGQEVGRGVLEQPNQATPGLLETTDPYTMGMGI